MTYDQCFFSFWKGVSVINCDIFELSIIYAEAHRSIFLCTRTKVKPRGYQRVPLSPNFVHMFINYLHKMQRKSLYAHCLISFSISTVLIFCLTTEVRPKSNFEEAANADIFVGISRLAQLEHKIDFSYIDQGILANQVVVLNYLLPLFLADSLYQQPSSLQAKFPCIFAEQRL